MTVRPERAADAEAVWALNTAAFGRPDEADLVDRLRETPGYLALVSEDAGEIVGHIVFSPVTLDPPANVDVRGLAPMAVAPDRQRSGIGSALANAGLDACRADGAEAVVVLGHPDYYPRFGFVPGPPRGITCTYDVPDEAFMVLDLVPGALAGTEAVVRYGAAFGD